MKNFFAAFPTLKVKEDLEFLFEGVAVDSVTLVKTGNFLRVKISGGEMISAQHRTRMEEELSHQVLNGMIPVQLVDIPVQQAAAPAPAANLQMEQSPMKPEPLPAPAPVVSAPAPAPVMSAPEPIPDAVYMDDYEYEYVALPPVSETKKSSRSSSGYAPGGGGGAGKKRYTAKKKGPDPGMLYGREFKGSPTEIADIIGEMRDVIIRGEIFETELTTTKTGFKIFKISITDNKDSISMKMFLKEGEEELPDIFSESRQGAVLRYRVDQS